MSFFKKLFNSEKPRKLQWPPTVRPLKAEEVPLGHAALSRIHELAKADIREGYTLKQNTDKKELPFTFYAEINVDNDRLWEVFVALSAMLPDMVSCLFAHKNADPIYGGYLTKRAVLNILGYYRTELTQDCFLEFGIIFHDDSRLVEIYVPDAKYIQFWGVDEVAFRALMKEQGLNEEKELKFIDEYPKAVEALTNLKSDAIPTSQVILALNTAFCS